MEQNYIKIEEGVFNIYDTEKNLVCMIKRDDLSKKHIAYKVTEMAGEELADLLTGNNLKA
jgi:hypothetical protein